MALLNGGAKRIKNQQLPLQAHSQMGQVSTKLWVSAHHKKVSFFFWS